MKYRIIVEVLESPAVYDPGGSLCVPNNWRTAFYQSFDNDKADKVTAAVALAVNVAVNEAK